MKLPEIAVALPEVSRTSLVLPGRIGSGRYRFALNYVLLSNGLTSASTFLATC